MRPIGLRFYWLDFSSFTTFPSANGRPRPASAVAYLKSLHVFEDSGRYEAISETIALATIDEPVALDPAAHTPVRTRAWYVALARDDTTYIIVATFSQALRTRSEAFTPGVIAAAERIVRGLYLGTAPPQ